MRDRLGNVVRVERAGGELGARRADVQVHSRLAVLQKEVVVLRVRRLKDALRERLEDFLTLYERIFRRPCREPRRIFRGKRIAPGLYDLVPVERAFHALALHHHGEVVMKPPVVLCHLRGGAPRRTWIVVGHRDKPEPALQVLVEVPLAHAVPVRRGLDLYGLRPVQPGIWPPVARRRIVPCDALLRAHLDSGSGDSRRTKHHEFSPIHRYFAFPHYDKTSWPLQRRDERTAPVAKRRHRRQLDLERRGRQLVEADGHRLALPRPILVVRLEQISRDHALYN